MKREAAQSIKNEEVKLERHLLNSGLKFSVGRKAVFDLAMQAHGHFTAEDLVKQCKVKNSKTSRATIYRTLKELLEAGLVRKTAFGEKHDHFEHTYDEKLHHHAHCIRCHQNLEFPDLQEDKIYHHYIEKKGFKILGHEMLFYGICHTCQSKHPKE